MLRFALAFIAATLMFFAGIQAMGRIFFANLSDLEPAINELLVSYDVSMEGADGGWRHLNPIFRARRITFVGGRLEDVLFELDLLKSLFYNRVIANRLTVESAYIGLEHMGSGWRLRGAKGASQQTLDIVSLLIDSEDVRVSAKLEGFRYGSSASIVVRATGVNRDGHRRISLTIDSGKNCEPCRGSLGLEFRDSFWGGSGGHGRGFIELSDVTFNDNLAEILGFPAGKLNVTGGWKKGVTEELFFVDVMFEGGIDNDSRFVASANLTGLLQGDEYRGLVKNVRLDSVASHLEFSPLTIVTNARDRLEVFSPVIDLRNVSMLATHLYGRDHPVSLWIRQVDASGHLQKAVVHIDEQGPAFGAQLSRVSLKSYRGLPGFQNVSGSIGGPGNVIRLDLVSDSGAIMLPKVFDGPLSFDRAFGPVVFWFGRDHVGIRGDDLSVTADGSVITGGFGISMPRKDRNDHQTTLIANVTEMDVSRAKKYVPNGLPQGLKPWLTTSLRDVGSVSAVQFVYHGRNVIYPGLPLRRAELLADFESVSIDYHEDWPLVSGADGRLEVTARESRVELREATSFDTKVTNADVSIPSNGSYIDANLDVVIPFARALLFVQETPIHELFPILGDRLVGDGSLSVGASLRLPLKGRMKEPGDFKLSFEFNNAAVSINDLGLRFDALNGAVEYHSPHTIVNSDLSAHLFNTPIDIDVTSGSNAQEEFMGVALTGQINATDLLAVLEINDTGIATGTMEYSANLSMFPDSSRPPELTFNSDLVGVDLSLPEEWGKPANVSRSLDVNIQFFDSYSSVAFRHGGIAGWAHVSDGHISRGSVGVGTPAVVVSENEEHVVISGGLKSFEIDSDLVDSDNPIRWRLNNFRVNALRASGVELTNAIVSGQSFAGAVEVQLSSDQIDATFVRKLGEPWQVDVNEIRIPNFNPVGNAETSDPISLDMIEKVVPADITVRRVLVNDKNGLVNDYGSWRFSLRPQPDGLRVLELEAEIRGIEISGDREVFWTRSTNRTRFVGSIRGLDLASVLSQWGFELNVEGESFLGEGDFTWRGSPLAFAIKDIEGSFVSEIKNGRFPDIEQGGGIARILGLLNYSTIGRRLTGNFSDVVSKGISFNRIQARMNFQSGILAFEEPMFVEGNGLLFRINGTVNLTDGRLDNELVVTLPVSDSLPWYAAYIAIANPAAGVGVLLGRRIFGAQIESLSSGKYHISGTLNHPRVEFESIFTTDMDNSRSTRTEVEKEQ
ncbi:MAG: AsmA-like C-terminal region-containing protein [Pseudomonadales bacterium]